MKKTKIEYDLVTDTREQTPLPFKKTVVKKLDFGDYGCEVNGELLPVVFERKNPADLLSTITSGHDRFKREMIRANEAGFKFIMLIECSYTDFTEKKFAGAYHHKLRPDIFIKILHTMIIRYNLEFVFCKDRSEACHYVRNYFNALVSEYDKEGLLGAKK